MFLLENSLIGVWERVDDLGKEYVPFSRNAETGANRAPKALNTININSKGAHQVVK